MSDLKIVTFTGTSPEGLYDMTMPVESGNMILVSARVDIDISANLADEAGYQAIPKSVSLEIGTVISNSHVIDNNPSANFLIVPLEFTGGNAFGAFVISSSTTNPNIGFRMNGALQRQCRFVIRNSDGSLFNAAILRHFCFSFQYV